ncbi:TIGR02444 family protein [Paracoccus sp. Z118]|uniref:TIGR02444 family protein n=1 Tax=Paracoccus sp. Z118 TaxID=2851017 RepID=UPI001C2BDEE5|nr:TIGR02444 family protein [Paracoccus sp. Z118]MBV0893076.1 TIGR02444 family protein [Paracoccus sp. Z118]
MTTADAPDLQGPLWDFALRFYARPGVAPACLELQECFHLDVPLMIAALYARTQGHVVDDTVIAALDARTAGWRDEAIRPLRAIRRNMKAGPWMKAHQAVPALREEIKRLELRAEQMQLSLLESVILELRSDQRDADADADALRAVAALVVNNFTGTDSDAPELTVIAMAAVNAARESQRIT